MVIPNGRRENQQLGLFGEQRQAAQVAFFDPGRDGLMARHAEAARQIQRRQAAR